MSMSRKRAVIWSTDGPTCNRSACRAGNREEVVDRLLDRRLWAGARGHAFGALEGSRLVRACTLITKRPRKPAGVSLLDERLARLAAVRSVPGNARNVRAADTDIGQLAVAQARQFVDASVVSLPLLDEADECGNHGGPSFLGSGSVPVDCSKGT